MQVGPGRELRGGGLLLLTIAVNYLATGILHSALIQLLCFTFTKIDGQPFKSDTPAGHPGPGPSMSGQAAIPSPFARGEVSTVQEDHSLGKAHSNKLPLSYHR